MINSNRSRITYTICEIRLLSRVVVENHHFAYSTL